MIEDEQLTNPNRSTQWSLKETLARVTKPVAAAALATLALSACGAQTAESPSPPETDASPETATSVLLEQYALEFATEAASTLPADQPATPIEFAGDEAGYHAFEVTNLTDEELNTPLEGGAERSVVTATLDMADSSITVTGLRESKPSLLHRISVSFRVAPGNPILVDTDAPLRAGDFVDALSDTDTLSPAYYSIIGEETLSTSIEFNPAGSLRIIEDSEEETKLSESDPNAAAYIKEARDRKDFEEAKNAILEP